MGGKSDLGGGGRGAPGLTVPGGGASCGPMIASELGRLTRRLHPSARPLVIVFMVPLAASCLLAAGSHGPVLSAREAMVRSAEVSLLPDRIREVFEAMAEEAKPHDPPARSSRWLGDGGDASDCLAAPADGVLPLQAGTPRFLAQTSETLLNAPRSGAHPRRGPPGAVT